MWLAARFLGEKYEGKTPQRQFFFWYKGSERQNIIHELRRIGRPDLIAKLF